MTEPSNGDTEAPWSAGLRGARANLLPGLALQLFALGLVIAYYHHEPTRAACERLAVFRTEKGLLYSIIATGVCGGLLPCLYMKLNRRTRHRYTVSQNALLTAFWAYKGLEVDLWYRVLNRFVGTSNEAVTVVSKMFLDQFIYCPLFAVPVTVIVYGWGETHFNASAVTADLRQKHWYRNRVLPMLISNLAVWVPTVCIIYSLPSPLQIPLFNLVLCFFTLILAHISREEKPATAATSTR